VTDGGSVRYVTMEAGLSSFEVEVEVGSVGVTGGVLNADGSGSDVSVSDGSGSGSGGGGGVVDPIQHPGKPSDSQQ
jgi:hypothetical protein